MPGSPRPASCLLLLHLPTPPGESSGSRQKRATLHQSEAQAVTFVIQVLPFPRHGLNRLILKRRDEQTHVHGGPTSAGAEAAGLRASPLSGSPGGITAVGAPGGPRVEIRGQLDAGVPASVCWAAVLRVPGRAALSRLCGCEHSAFPPQVPATVQDTRWAAQHGGARAPEGTTSQPGPPHGLCPPGRPGVPSALEAGAPRASRSVTPTWGGET